MKTRNVAMYGMLIALAFILSYIESIIPIPVPIPGIKIGLANLVVITALFTMGPKQAFVLSMLRIVLVGFTFGNLSTMMFSFAGGMLSWLLMVAAKRWKRFSMTGVSILGGIGHNIGQILVAMWVINNSVLLYYLPFLIISGLVTGAVIGIVGALITANIKKLDFMKN
ncbi:heptaprenyl diphosphate synthase [Kineothrix alysoides]|uniref:Heptaprenyl diphosphate synthase n=1 Tax=Kineothrix alysoides TaxID=1469948 RepID=A0A4R1QMY1_9FIRM|nr:Gx transporter family protein [Kineothrix alysoides]TCL55036.1 heptaprenyl diphosphate synthase [Kineothrix alysoides]